MKNFIQVLYGGKPLAININHIETIRANDKGQVIIVTTTGQFTLNEDFESVCEKIRIAQSWSFYLR